MRVELAIELSDGTFSRLDATGPTLTVGRDPDCDFSLPDDAESGFTSALHCEFFTHSGSVMLRDRNSTNGTLVNETLIESAIEVHAGDTVRLGRHGPVARLMTVSVNDAVPTQPKPETAKSPAAATDPLVPAGGPGISRQSLAVVAIVASVIVLAGGVWWWLRPDPAEVADESSQPAIVPQTMPPEIRCVDDVVTVVAGSEIEITPLDNDELGSLAAVTRIVGATAGVSGANVRVSDDGRSVFYQPPVDFHGTDKIAYEVEATVGSPDALTDTSSDSQFPSQPAPSQVIWTEGRIHVAVTPAPYSIERLRPHLVWVGLVFDGRLFCEGTGLLMNERWVLTSGRLAREMRDLTMPSGQAGQPPQFQSFIRYGETISYVESVSIHPRQEAAEPGSITGVQYDVGFLRLRIPLPNVRPMSFARPGAVIAAKQAAESGAAVSGIGSDGRPVLTADSQLRLAGWHDPLPPETAFDPVQVRIREFPLKVTQSLQEDLNADPVSMVEIQKTPDAEDVSSLTGGIAFDDFGIVGVVVVTEAMSLIIPVTNIAPWVSSTL